VSRARRALVLVALAAALVGFDWTGRLGRLDDDLHSPSAQTRAAAVRELGTHPAAEVAGRVLEALGDPDPGVRSDAAQTAAQLRLAEAAPILMRWLDEPDEDLRVVALEALGAMPGDGPVAALVRALADARALVRRAAVRGLRGRSETSAAITSALIGALDDVDGSVRLESVGALVHRARWAGGGDDGTVDAALRAHVSDDAPEVRAAVAASLGALGDPDASVVLLRLAADPLAEVRSAAAAALGRLRPIDAAAALAAMSRHDELEPAHAALAALGRIPGAEAFDALADGGARGGASADVAHHALLERVRLDPVAARAEIAGALGARDRARAAWLAAELARGAAPSLPEATPALEALLEAEEVPMAVALAAIGRSGGPRALPRLLRALDETLRRGTSPEPEIAGLTAYFETSGADGRATEPLVQALAQRTEPALQAALARLLGTTESARASEALAALLASETDPGTTVEALRALTRIARVAELPPAARASSLAAAQRALRASSPELRHAGGELLAAAGDGATLAAALDAIDHEPHLDRAGLLVAAARLAARIRPGEAATEALAATIAARIASEDPALAAAAITAAALAGDDDALAAVRQAATRHDDALGALARFSQPAALEPLREELAEEGLDPASATRRALAAGALGEHGTAEDAARLFALAPSLPWPASAAASFSLARLARRGVLDAGAIGPLCALAARRDPIVRANVAIALTALGGACAEIDLAAWAERPHSAVVRAAALRWIAARPEGLPRLARCRDELPPALVERACASPALPPLGGTTEITAFEADGLTLAPSRWLAVIFADGTVLLTRTDAQGRIALDDAASGPVVLEDPANLPLGP
jgi:HEAT repeat protein